MEALEGEITRTVVSEFASHGLLGILLGLSIFAIWKLLKYIDNKNNEYEKRINDIINRHETIREKSEEKFLRAIEKVEQNVQQMVDEFRLYLRK